MRISRPTPVNELRTWHGHDPAKYTEFVHHYHAELESPAAGRALQELRAIAAEQDATLVTTPKNVKRLGTLDAGAWHGERLL